MNYMDIIKPTFALIARWKVAKDIYFTPPDRVRWDDGSPATVDEYWAHELDTQECIQGDKGGLEMRIYPEIIADVEFNPSLGAWVADGPGVASSALEESDPDASDDFILAALCRLPIYYRARVHRGPHSYVTGRRQPICPGKGTPSEHPHRTYLLQHCHYRGIQ